MASLVISSRRIFWGKRHSSDSNTKIWGSKYRYESESSAHSRALAREPQHETRRRTTSNLPRRSKFGEGGINLTDRFLRYRPGTASNLNGTEAASRRRRLASKLLHHRFVHIVNDQGVGLRNFGTKIPCHWITCIANRDQYTHGEKHQNYAGRGDVSCDAVCSDQPACGGSRIVQEFWHATPRAKEDARDEEYLPIRPSPIKPQVAFCDTVVENAFRDCVHEGRGAVAGISLRSGRDRAAALIVTPTVMRLTS